MTLGTGTPTQTSGSNYQLGHGYESIRTVQKADDRRTKFRLYARAGVREYWIVDLERRTIEVFALRGHSFTLLNRYEPGETVRSQVLPDFGIAVEAVCPP